MKFLVDANLPLAVKKWLRLHGHDAVHTLDLPNRSFTVDMEIISIAEREERIIISKDFDFINHKIIRGTPKRLLIVTTGNIVNNVLIRLFDENFASIESAFELGHSLIELSNDSIIIHS